MARKSERNKNKDYNIGLDIGVGSVGWAVTNNYTLLKTGKQKNLWGYNIFEKAETAEKRRTYRSARRRLKRRKIRINLLQDLVSEMIFPVDPMFFKKLKYSYLVEEDKNEKEFFKEENILFDSNYTDKEFYKQYPTIYHLRKDLIESDKKFDPRLIYLAMHHIIKYRGNFLYEEQGQEILNEGSSININELFEAIFEFYNSKEFNFDFNIIKEIVIILNDNEKSGKDKLSEIKSLASDEAKKVLTEIINAVLGYNFDPKVLFFAESVGKTKFSSDDFEEKYDSIVSENEEAADLLEELKAIHNDLLLKKILGNVDKNSKCKLSDSMIDKYETHKQDLALLKKIAKYNSNIKNLLRKNGTYDNYVSYYKNNKKELTSALLYRDIKKELENDYSAEAVLLKQKIEHETLLPKCNSTDNGAIPYQYHYDELKKIIDNQEKYYNCLKKNKDKILSLVSFRTPYYVGPYDINNKENNSKNINNNFAWIKRKDEKNDPIRPWNFYDVVDIDETAKRFINRMRNHCKYLLEESTLPKNSLLLARFNLYNELNKIKYDDNKGRFNEEIKEKIISDLFLKKSQVKANDLKEWIVNNQLVEPSKEIVLSGFQGDDGFASNLKMEIKFRELFGDAFESKKEDIEKIIEYLTIYNNKKIIERRLRSEKLCDESLINSILKIKCTGYGRLSKRLINGLISQNINGQFQGTIMDILKKTNKNFMEILNDNNYGFIDEINEINNLSNKDNLNYEIVEKLPCSPSLRRGIWQSIRVVQDIIKYMGHEPNNIYIEFARGEQEGSKSYKRYTKLEKIYKEHFKKSYEFDRLKENKDKLSDIRLYLYFMQNCKCMYSKEPLEIEELSSYQIDHIIPRCYTKDNSIDNLALVKSKENQRKADSLLLSNDIIKKQANWWKELLKYGLISQSKYNRLTKESLTDSDVERFISRDLTETRQICMHVKNILKEHLNTKVSVVHAGISSEFRKQNDLYKIREINNFHHAQDAYLTCLFGEFIDKKLPYFSSQNSIKYNQIKRTIEKRKNDEKKKIYSEKNTQSFIIYMLNNNEDIDDITGEVLNGSKQIEYIKRIFNYSDYFFNYQSRKNEGQLFKQTLVKAGSSKNLNRIKNNMPIEKYGGYPETKTSFVVLCEYTTKKDSKIIKELKKVPIIESNRLIDYLKKEIKGEIISTKVINIGQALIEDGSLYTIVSDKEIKSIQPIIIKNKNELKLLDFITKNKKLNGLNKEDENEEKIKEVLEKSELHNYVDDLLYDLLERIYKNIPRYKEEYKNKIDVSVNDLSYINKIKLIKILVSPLSGGKRVDKVNLQGINIASYGRLTKKIDIEKIELLYTSPSGIFSHKEKL